MIRAFIAIVIDSPLVREIRTLIEQLRPSIPEVRWVTPSNIHVTLKFLGDIDSAQVDPIADALKPALKLFPPFRISAKGLGVFPDPRRPRVLWVGLSGSHLTELAIAVERAMGPLGFNPENRRFQPHLTIGRWRQFNNASKNLMGELDRWKDHEFGESRVESVTLFQSELKSGGAVHEPLRIIATANK